MPSPNLLRRALYAAVIGLSAVGSVGQAAMGWRLDGSAVSADARPPVDWSTTHRAWSTTLPAWSNASPVPMGNLILVEAEPTTLIGVDAATGRIAWQVKNDYIDTLPAAERPAFQSRIDALPGLQTALKEAVAEVSRLRKVARSADAPADTAQRIQAFTAVMDALKSQIDGLTPYITPPDKDIIGYSSATPVTDGSRAYAMFGQGVLSAVDTSGRKLWTTWLGKAPRPMRGYEFGSVTSPLLVDGVLVIGHANLQGIDPATGRVLWKGPAWNHYGTPAVAQIGGRAFVITPDGKAIRARDGAEVARGMADLWYTGPVVAGDIAVWAGGFGHENQPDNTKAVAWRLADNGAGGLSPTRLWERPFANGARVYAPPVVFQGNAHVVDWKGNVTVIDVSTGADVATYALGDQLAGTVYSPPQVAGGKLVFASETGVVLFGTPGATWSLEARTSAGSVSRATPLFLGDRAFVRSASGLAAYR